MEQTNIRYVILEDEYYQTEELKRIIGELRPQYELLGVAEDLRGASELLHRQDTQLVFSDVQLCDGNVFDTLGGIRLPIIFTTAYAQYRDRASVYNTVDFLLKPVSDAGIRSSIERFERDINKYNHHFPKQ